MCPYEFSECEGILLPLAMGKGSPEALAGVLLRDLGPRDGDCSVFRVVGRKTPDTGLGNSGLP